MRASPKRDNEEHRYFNVDLLKEHFQKTPLNIGRGRRTVRRVLRATEEFSGIMTSVLGLPILLGPPLLVLTALRYGTWIFPVGLGLTIALTGYWVERKVGKSLRFEEYNFGKRLLALSLAFLLAVGLLFMMLYFPRNWF